MQYSVNRGVSNPSLVFCGWETSVNESKTIGFLDIYFCMFGGVIHIFHES